ncbi:nucleotidyltransferase [Propylenella binzhouense]|uniref:Nucleotidyltransferase family protein n=1 Tax=Propylenella binzhouense TaxID=2555902 RepID=A0A964T371_9HYPH|nr:hypothetical protein [Propylenella binzhouense]
MPDAEEKRPPGEISAAAPALHSPDAVEFYAEALRTLSTCGPDFLVAGTFAVGAYTGISRPTKDIDIFCKPGDYPRILHCFAARGYQTEIEDERWLAKVRRGELFFDVIFNSTAGVTPVTDQWFEEVREAEIFGTRVRVLPPTELIWSKAFVQNRNRYDGADIAHVMLKEHENIDWRRLLNHMEQYWEILLIHVLNFRFIYPTERHRVPAWLMHELLDRVRLQEELPVPQTKICRGRMLSRADFVIDVKEWGYFDPVGDTGIGDGR